MSIPFKVIDADDPAWRQTYDKFLPGDRDVFHHPGFARACADTIHKGNRVAAAIYSRDDIVILYPFVVRDVGTVTGHPEITDGRRDIVSLYGRGGALCATSSVAGLADFHAAFADWCREERIVCAFDRFHPVLENHRIAFRNEEIFDVGAFVVVDLRRDIGTIEAGFRHSMRKAIRKGDRAGVTVECHEDISELETFMTIYHESLDRNEARDFYYFPEDFYRAIARELPGHFAFYFGRLGDRVATCEFVLFSDRFGHSYLGGTRQAAFEASANQILKRDIVRDLKRRGCDYFLLGGGQKPNDGIFRYKLAYAPDGARQSYVGGTIFLPEDYAHLRDRMRASHLPVADGRFQFYDAA